MKLAAYSTKLQFCSGSLAQAIVSMLLQPYHPTRISLLSAEIPPAQFHANEHLSESTRGIAFAMSPAPGSVIATR